MRVRSLQTFLTSQNLVNTGNLEDLKDLRLGVDAVYWLRTLPNLKDPLADAIGGLPPSAFGVLDSNLKLLKEQEISALFVFQGMQPRSHMLFSSQLHQQMDEAWRLVSQGEYVPAQHRFAQATSRINSEFVHVVSHYLQSEGSEIFQAPYFAASQLSYFAQEGLVDAVFGPPALLLFGIPRVLIGINFQKQQFEWVDREQLLSAWSVTEEQLIDACLLAGTEYCLTFPYLNLSQFHGNGQHFHFGTAIDFIRQAPLVGYMQHFPSEEMRVDHVNGYCICKTLIKYPLALHLDGKVRPLTRRALTDKEGEVDTNDTCEESGAELDQKTNCEIKPKKSIQTGEDSSLNDSMIQVPDDFHKIVGSHLPNSIFFLMARNFLSRKLPAVLALGEWLDLSHPTVDSDEYRELLNEVQDYRKRAIGLLAMRLAPELQKKPIRFARYSCAPPTYGQSNNFMAECLPDCRPGMAWNFTMEELRAEMKRQGAAKISFRFCLIWHANEISKGKRLNSPLRTRPDGSVADGPLMKLTDCLLAQAAVFFMLLENLGYFTADGGVTVFGSALTSTVPEFEEDVLFALELMKCGELMGEPLESPSDRPFPPSISILKHPENSPHQHHILLISRVTSLIPMKLTNAELWLSPVDFDLAAYHSIVKTLKRTFRHLSEACLANLLLQDLTATSVIAPKDLDPRVGGFPSFMLPRNCMGIIVKHFLEYRFKEGTESPSSGPSSGKLRALESELQRFYPCGVDHIADLFTSIRYWNEMVRVTHLLSQNLDVDVLKVDMDKANQFLLRRVAEVGLHLHPTFQTAPFAKMREAIATHVTHAMRLATKRQPGAMASPKGTAHLEAQKSDKSTVA